MIKISDCHGYYYCTEERCGASYGVTCCALCDQYEQCYEKCSASTVFKNA